ncbi:MAG TPA: hypothetical protein VED84_06370 [Acidimicrobiales bacterium]|nr:hypothetical protein [Acidimicrobiales bacterium]
MLLAVLVGVEAEKIVGATFGAVAGAIPAVPAAGSLPVAGRELLAERRRAPARQSGEAVEG